MGTHSFRVFPGGALLLSLLILAGCVYQEPPPDRVDLVELLPAAKTTLQMHGFDLASPLLIPYLSGFGEYLYSGTVASATSNVAFSVPPWIDRPGAVAIQARLASPASQNSFIQIHLNDILVGRMPVTADSSIKIIKLRKKHFYSGPGTLVMKTTGNNAGVEIEQIWLLPTHRMDPADLSPGNHFAGVIWFPQDGYWQDAVILPPGEGLWFPVHVPYEPAMVLGEFFCEGGGPVDITMELVTARAFRSEEPLTSRILFRDTPEWLPVQWDVSSRSDRYAALRFTNNGNDAILIRNGRVAR